MFFCVIHYYHGLQTLYSPQGCVLNSFALFPVMFCKREPRPWKSYQWLNVNLILDNLTGSFLIAALFETSNCQRESNYRLFQLPSSTPHGKRRLHLQCPHTAVPLSLTANFSLYCCWGPAAYVSLTLDVNAGLFLSVS